MKTTITTKELIELDACESMIDVFKKVHGDNVVKFSEAFKSNGWDDIWWLIMRIESQLSKGQLRDLRLLGCDWAESCLSKFESQFPDDDRPRNAIEVSRRYANGRATIEELDAAESPARMAVRGIDPTARAAESAARMAAQAAARAAAEWAVLAAVLAAESAGWAGVWAGGSVGVSQKEDLMNLFKKWESDNEQ